MLVKSLVSTAVPLSRRVLAINAPCLSAVPRRFTFKITEFNKPVTIDEVTCPCGSWQEHYDNKQRKYNIFLISSFGFFIITAFAVLGTGNIYWGVHFPDPTPRK